MHTQYLDRCAVVDRMNGDSHSIGTIGRYEVILADSPRRRSAFEITAGTRADTCVWLMQGPVYCCWQGTVERIIADPSCASAFLSDAQCTELAAMVAATRITSLEVLRAAGYDVDDAAESLQAVAEAGQVLIDAPDDGECPGCGALRDEATTPGCEHADGCGREG
jgi:hypothetical protein